jgi:hypothetical protein
LRLDILGNDPIACLPAFIVGWERQREMGQAMQTRLGDAHALTHSPARSLGVSPATSANPPPRTPARFALTENARTDGRENEWQLTASGSELETAIRHDAGRRT